MTDFLKENLEALQNIRSVRSLYFFLQEFHCGLSETFDEFPSYQTFREIIYHTWHEEPYVSFSIPKKNGDIRLIETPKTEIKIIQKTLNSLLKTMYLVIAITKCK